MIRTSGSGSAPASLKAARNGMTPLVDAIASFADAADLQGWQPATTYTYLHILRNFVRFCQAHTEHLNPTLAECCTPAVVTAYIAHKKRTASGRTANGASCALRALGNWLETQQWDCDVSAFVNATRVKRAKTNRREAISLEEAEAMLAGAKRHDDPVWAARDEALIRFLSNTGCRSGALLRMRWGNLDLEAGHVYYPLMKGGGDGTATLTRATCEALEHYRKLLRVIRRPNSGEAHVWQGPTRACLGDEGFRRVWRGILARADLRYRTDIVPHRFRHGMATRALERGVPPTVVAAQGGWQGVRTLLQVYAHRPDQRVIEEHREEFGIG